MKYILMDYKDGDCFTAEFESKEEALQEAEGQWEHLTRCDPETPNRILRSGKRQPRRRRA